MNSLQTLVEWFFVWSIPAILYVIAGLVGIFIAYFLYKYNKKRDFKFPAAISIIILYSVTIYSFAPLWNAATYESKIKEGIPVLKIIAKYYPEAFAVYLIAARKHILAHDWNRRLEVDYSITLINWTVKKSLAYASGKDIFSYLKAQAAFDQKLHLVDPLLVLDSKYPARIPDFVIKKDSMLMPQGESEKIFQAKGVLITAGAKHQIITNFSDKETAQAKQDFLRILSVLNEKYGKEAVDNTFSTKGQFIDPEKSVQIITSLYESIFALGEDNGGALFKILYSSNGSNYQLINSYFPALFR